MNIRELQGYEITQVITDTPNLHTSRAVRLDDDIPVVIKRRQHDEKLSSGTCPIKHEFSLGRRLDSQRITTYLELLDEDGDTVLISESFGECSLKELSTAQTTDVATFVSIAVQLTEALVDIHKQGIIHNSLTPEHVLLKQAENGDWQLKVTDFMLASHHEENTLPVLDESQREKSLPYISPEQTGRLNRSVDSRSDLYAVGTLLYQLSCSAPPFDSQDPLELVHSHIARMPIPIEELRQDFPTMLTSIVMKLLNKSPEDRYKSAYGLLVDLQKCQQQLLQKGQIDDFPFGEQDVFESFHMSDKLYGRSQEISILIDSYERCRAGATDMIILTGESGIGKSSLVEAFEKQIRSEACTVVNGKFDQLTKGIAYSAISQAFEGLVQELLTESESKIVQWKNKFHVAWGNNGRLITDMIPSLTHIVGRQDPVEPLELPEAKNRLQKVFRQFVRLFSSEIHTMILFLDDLQWADVASLNLVSDLLLDSATTHLLIIGAYRDNEVGLNHPTQLMINELVRHKVNINHIHLQAIQRQDIHQLLVDAVSRDGDTVDELTELIYTKTLGNAFFVRQFLKSLADEDLLHYDIIEHQWQWDIQRIINRKVTENVVELMTNKIALFMPSTQKIMQLASILGARLDPETLGVISFKTKQEVLYELQAPISEGLLISNSSGLQFLHDRVQEASYEMIDVAERKAVHLNVAELLLLDASTLDLQDRLFEIVGHFIKGIDLISDKAEKYRIAELFLQASEKAINASAFESSLQYSAIAIEKLLSEEAWEEHYELTWTLYKNKGYCEYTTLKLQDSEQTLLRCLEQSNTQDHKVTIHTIYSRLLFQMNKHHEGIQNTREGLKYLGIEVPKKITRWHVAWQVLKCRFTMGILRRPEALLKQAETHDPLVLNISRVLYDSVESSYMVDANTMAYFSLVLANLCVKHGNTMYAPFAYGMLTMVLTGKTREFSLANRFANMAIELSDKHQDKGVKGRVYVIAANFTHHWINPIKGHSKLVKIATQCCVETGSLHWANYSIVCSRPQSVLFNSHSLKQVIEDNEHAYNFHYEHNDREVILQQSHTLGFCYWLSQTERVIDEKKPALDNEMYEREMSQPGNFLIRTYYHFFQMLQAYLQADLDSAIKYGAIAVNYAPETMGNLIEAPVRFIYLLCLLQKKDARLATWRRLSLTYQKPRQLLKHMAKANPNEFMPMELMLRAEEARVDENQNAVELYDKAILAANKTGYHLFRAMANELAAIFYLKQDRHTVASAYMGEAYKIYYAWGALAKTQLMEREFPEWFIHGFDSIKQRSHKERVAGNEWQNELDVMALIDVSQIISSELKLDRLIAKLMHIIIENAGAQEGCLILDSGDGLRIVALENGEQDIITEQQAIAFDDCDLVSGGIIRYVYRSGEALVLDDAINAGNFVDDPHVIAQQVKSVLCLPLLRQEKVIGVVYLENNLATSVFTDSRVTVTSLLLSQASISLENAELFEKHKQTEIELKKSQAWLRTLIDTVPSMIYVKNAEGRFLEVNKAVADSLGMSRDEVVGRLHTEIHPDRNEVKAMLYIDRQVLESGQESHVEQQKYSFNDGSKRWMRTIKVPCPESVFGEPAIVGINIDITDLRAADKELRQLRNYLTSVFNSMPSILIGVDENGKVTQWNQQAENFTKIDHQHALGHLLVKVFPQLTHEINKVETAIQTQQVLVDKKRESVHDGKTLFQDITIYPLVAEGIKGAVIRIDDVTEQVQLEEMIIQSEKMLSVGGLAAGMAHEINNPLAGMMQTANVMRNRLADDDLSANKQEAQNAGTDMEAIHRFMDNRDIFRMLNSINEAGVRVADIVDNMLNFSRKSEVISSTVDINVLLNKTLALATTDYDLKNEYDFKTIKITKEYGDNLPLVPCEPSKIQQVFLNILRNGAQAMQTVSSGEQHFLLTTSYDAELQRVIIEIEDTGPGMDDITTKRIFDPFFTTKAVGLGTGLGLSVSYFIITEHHEGEMMVESELGQGCRFIIRLPIET